MPNFHSSVPPSVSPRQCACGQWFSRGIVHSMRTSEWEHDAAFRFLFDVEITWKFVVLFCLEQAPTPRGQIRP